MDYTYLNVFCISDYTCFDMERLFVLQDQLLKLTPMGFIRNCAENINWNAQLLSIRGAKGVGKTTMILQHIRQNFGKSDRKALYCSLDANYFVDHSILDLVDIFYRNGGKYLFLDEIHKYENWSREIKEVYDFYPDLHLVVSGSSLLSLMEGDVDLSRRCVSHDIQGLSLREYLQFYKGIDIPKHSLQEILENPEEICDKVNNACRPTAVFNEYLQHGYYPYYYRNEIDYYSIINNVVRYVIEQELPRICKVDLGNTRKIRSLMNMLASSEPYEVDISKMSVQSGLQRPTVLSYLKYLGDAKLLTLLYSDLTNVKRMQKPDKIYIENPNMLHAIASHPIKEGTLRETFAVSQLAFEHQVEFKKEHGDFLIDGTYTLEIGGANKKFGQIAGIPDSYVLADDVDYPVGNKLPLWILGFLY